MVPNDAIWGLHCINMWHYLVCDWVFYVIFMLSFVIYSQVINAQQAIAQESEENYHLTQQLGKYPAPEVNQPRSTRATGNEGN